MTAARCSRCRVAPGVLHAYWGPPFCAECAQAIAAYFDRHRAWPPEPEP